MQGEKWKFLLIICECFLIIYWRGSAHAFPFGEGGFDSTGIEDG